MLLNRKNGSNSATATCVPVCCAVFIESCRRSQNAWTFFSEKRGKAWGLEFNHRRNRKCMAAMEIHHARRSMYPWWSRGKLLVRLLSFVPLFRHLADSGNSVQRVHPPAGGRACVGLVDW